MACRQDLPSFPLFPWLYLCPSVSSVFSKCLLPHTRAINLLKILLKLDGFWPSQCFIFNFLKNCVYLFACFVFSLGKWRFYPGSEAWPSQFITRKNTGNFPVFRSTPIEMCKTHLPDVPAHTLPSPGVRSLNLHVLAKKKARTILHWFALAKNIHKWVVLIRSTSSLCLRKKIHRTEKQVVVHLDYTHFYFKNRDKSLPVDCVTGWYWSHTPGEAIIQGR